MILKLILKNASFTRAGIFFVFVYGWAVFEFQVAHLGHIHLLVTYMLLWSIILAFFKLNRTDLTSPLIIIIIINVYV